MTQESKNANAQRKHDLAEEIERMLEEVEGRCFAQDFPQRPHEADEQEQEQQEDSEQELPPEQPQVVFYVFAPPLPEEEEEAHEQEDWTVEGSIDDAQAAASVTIEPEEKRPPGKLPLTRPSRPARLSRVPLVVWVLAGMCLCALLLGMLTFFLQPETEVTLIPDERTLTTSMPITLLTQGQADPAKEQVAGRLLDAVHMSEQRKVATTGSGHQQAASAHGLLTFYNALPASQTIPAGTLLTGASGVQMVTDQDAVLPAAVPPVEGQASVPAHAVLTGPSGNIAASDISGSCCRLDVFVQSSAFGGGQDARSFQAVSMQDIEQAKEASLASLDSSMQAAFASQVQASETLMSPLPCSPTVTTDHQAGEEARLVTVTVTQTCTGLVYNTQGMLALLTHLSEQQAIAQLGGHYSLIGDVHLSVKTGVTQVQHTEAGITIQIGSLHIALSASLTQTQDGGGVSIEVQAQGTWAYQWSEQELQGFGSRIAGQSEEGATNLLLHEPGVHQVFVHRVSGLLPAWQTNLPTDAHRIHVTVLAAPM